MAERDQIIHGDSPQDPPFAVRREFGNLTLVKETTREAWGWRSLERLWIDARYAFRTMRHNAGFTVVAVVSLALGIGANTSIFSILDAVLLKPLPVSHPERLRILTWVRNGDGVAGLTDHSGYSMSDDEGRNVDGSFSYPAYRALESTLPQFAALVAFAPNSFTVTAGGTTDSAFGQYVSGNYFTGLGVQPSIGRTILPEDDAAGKTPVVVLTNLYWARRFGSDRSVVGHVIAVNRRPLTVIGILPPAFQGLSPGGAIDLFVPMSIVPEMDRYYSLTNPSNWWVQIFGSLKPGVSDVPAREAVESSLAHQIGSYASSKANGRKPPQIVLEPGNRGVGLLRASLKKAIYLIATATLLVLLIACINLANLLMARYTSRTKEIAIRLSIGAGRWRLMRQMLTESLLLAGIGGAGGLLLAKPALRLLLHFFSQDSTFGINPQVDARTLAFTLALSVATAILFGTMPAWRATAHTVGLGLKESQGVSAGRRAQYLLGHHLVSLQTKW
ncbi:MAG: ABC transporter permease [Bryobacteraceae bacterium]